MRTLVVACAALASGLAIGVGPAAAARGMEVGLQDDLLFLHRGAESGEYFSPDLAFEKMRAMQGSALRVTVVWTHAVADDQERLARKPAVVEYDWQPYDTLLELAHAYGVRVQFVLTGPAPAWGTASGQVERGYYRPNARYYREFVDAVARHFKGQVERYSIWNEPNWDTWLGPSREAAARYRELYRIGYSAIKSVDPAADVWIGELAPRATSHSIAPLEFLRRVACVDDRYRRKRCAGGTLVADGFAHHPYEFDGAPDRVPRRGRDDVSIGTLDRLTKALDRLAAARALVPRTGPWLPIYLTEFGYFRAGERKIRETKRAAWLVEGFDIALRNPRVKQLVHYLLVRPPWGIFFDTSLVDAADGTETKAYKALVRWANQAAAKGRITRLGNGPGGHGAPKRRGPRGHGA